MFDKLICMNERDWQLAEPARQTLQDHAHQTDVSVDWPAYSWQVLKQNDILRWAIPQDYGGLGLSSLEQLQRNEVLAAHCLTTAFILSQREAGIRQLLKGPQHLQQRYLPGLAAGKEMLTVGLSQLTTSRQHGQPALRAIPLADGRYQLDGIIPWVTAADHSTAIVGGATLPDDLQFLFVIPTNRNGLAMDAPMTLTALAGSRTTAVHFEKVILQADELLTAPTNQVLGKSGGGGLETSCLAIGLAKAALDLVRPEAATRVDVGSTLTTLEAEIVKLRTRLHQSCVTPVREEVLQLRSDCTLFVLRATQTALLLTKGTGFVAPQPAQRLAKQALFFLVWSCPRPASQGVLEVLRSGGIPQLQ